MEEQQITGLFRDQADNNVSVRLLSVLSIRLLTGSKVTFSKPYHSFVATPTITQVTVSTMRLILERLSTVRWGLSIRNIASVRA